MITSIEALMNKFVQGSELNFALERLIKNANETLLLISPYIKLHSRIRDQLKLKKNFPELKISIVYGKSEKGANRICEEDLKLFRELPNIEICYEKNLHAKYYANENEGLITSMNLYDFSQNNNIEVGVLSDVPNRVLSGINNIVGNADVDGEAYLFFSDVLSNAYPVFRKKAEFEKKLLGFKTNYTGSVIEIDVIDHYHDNKKEQFVGFKSYQKPPLEQKIVAQQMGFCIRYGDKIPFNISKPYCEKAYNSWAKFGNDEYPEKFCHFTGEKTDGFTCYANPILKKNWREAKRTFNF